MMSGAWILAIVAAFSLARSMYRELGYLTIATYYYYFTSFVLMVLASALLVRVGTWWGRARWIEGGVGLHRCGLDRDLVCRNPDPVGAARSLSYTPSMTAAYQIRSVLESKTDSCLRWLLGRCGHGGCTRDMVKVR